MADIPSTPPVTSAPQVVPVSGNVPVIEAAVNNVPANIQQLAKQLELSGTLAQQPTDSSIIINTVAGQITFVLPQLLAVQKDRLLQQLLNVFQNNKPLTIIMQPGNPPAQAFLLLPPVTAQPQNAAARTALAPVQMPAAQPPVLPPLLPNTLLSAVVLPRIPPANIQPQQPGGNPSFQPSPAYNPDSLAQIIQEQLANSSFRTAAPPNPQAATPPGLPASTPQLQPQQLPPQLTPSVSPQGAYIPAELPVFSATLPEQIIVQETLAKLEGKALPNILPPTVPSYPGQPKIEYQAQIQPNIPPNVSPSFPALSRAADFSPALAPTSSFALKPGMEVSLRVMAILAPSVQNPVPPAPNQILATVAGNGPGGQLILKAGDAALYVRQPADLPQGTQLVLTVEPGKADAAPLTLQDPQQFSALQQVVAALTQADPAMARQIVDAHLPQPGAALPGALLFFLSAIRQGDIRNWLGAGAVDLLARAGKFDLVSRMAEEFQQAGQPARDAVVGEWRSYPIPIHDQNQFHMINLYVHRDPRHAPQKDEAAGRHGVDQIRFLIDMRMSRLGAIQLDGFVRRRQLDIVVRSERRLPEDLHRELQLSYIKTLGAIDYAGGIRFQTGRQNWLNIQKQAAQAGVVT